MILRNCTHLSPKKELTFEVFFAEVYGCKAFERYKDERDGEQIRIIYHVPLIDIV